MVSASTLCKNLMNVNASDVVIEDSYFTVDAKEVKHLKINARPSKRKEHLCPKCSKKCPVYDHRSTKTWRGVDAGGLVTDIESEVVRVTCPEHGVVTASVPWAYEGSRFTKDFDFTVSWLARYLPRSTVCQFMRIDWETIGRCIGRTLHVLEPDLSSRLNGLVNIGIDETSYKKGYKYITVIVNHDTNSVVWVHDGHGKSVLTEFFNTLTPEQRASIKCVTGDGARWITECVEEFLPGCTRCIDPFHVVEWAMDALDEVRREAWRKAQEKSKELEKKHPPKKGRPKADDKAAQKIKEAKNKASEIKGSAYALGKAPEHLTENQQKRLEMISLEDKRLYRAYTEKEQLRLLLKMDNVKEAEDALKTWLWKTSHSKIPVMVELSRKIRRHKEHILNTIALGLSNARVEATNNNIKLIIRKAYGFRNLDNMMAMIYLVCSDLEIPLPNRAKKSPKAA